MDPIDLAHAAARAHHVLTSSTRRRENISRYAWSQLLAHDQVDRPFRGVVVVPGTDNVSLTRARAALGALQCDAALTGWSAAHLYGLIEAAPTEVHLLLRHGASVTRRDGLRLTETSAFPSRLRRRHDLPVVPGGRMLADLASTTHVDALRSLAIDARFQAILGHNDLDEEVAGRRRFPGRARLRRLADDLRDDSSDSGFEFHARDRLGEDGLAPDPGQHVLRVRGRERRIDLPWSQHLVGVECLGLAAHSGRRAFDEDAERRNDFAEDSTWTILELTWTTFHTQWPQFVERLRRLLRP